jgi:FtsZ-binding cell division protein ZapB
MPRKAAGPKDPFADLSEDFRDSIDRMTRDEIKAAICGVTLAQLELEEAQKADEDYQSLKEQFSEAGAIYREGAKSNKLKIQYAKQALEGKGG